MIIIKPDSFTILHQKGIMQNAEIAATTPRPFHKTVVERLRQATTVEQECLAELIKDTDIPKDHDEIIAMWKMRRAAVGWAGDEHDCGVTENVLAKKKAAEAKAAKKPPRDIDDNDISAISGQLITLEMLLDQADPSYAGWQSRMKEELKRTIEIISQILGK